MRLFLPALLLLLIAAFAFQSCQDASAKSSIADADGAVPDEKAPAAGIRKSDLRIQHIKLEEAHSSSQVSGRVIPQHITQLFAEVQGKVRYGSTTFKEGINFGKGQPIIIIDDQEFAFALDAQRSAFLNMLTSMIPDMKSDFPESYPKWKGYVDGYTLGTPLPELPAPLSQKEKYFITTYQVYSQYYQIKSQEERLKKYTISAPYPSTVTKANVDVGSLVSPGQPLGTIIHRYNYELEAGLNEAAASTLKVGDVVEFHTNDRRSVFKGTLVRVNASIDPQTQNRSAFFQLKGKGISSGMYLEGEVETGEQTAVAIIPRSAIGRDSRVLVLEGKVLKAKPVKPLDYAGDYATVNGLQTGDQLILNQFSIPVEGVVVKF